MATRVELLRSYAAPVHLQKPHLGQYPFASYEDETLESYDRSFLELPNRRGILADYYRTIFGSDVESMSAFVRFESHLNLTSAPKRFAETILLSGFEPDDFEELYPEVYSRNYTFAFDVSVGSAARNKLRRLFMERCHAVCEELNKCDGVTGFLEAEIIPSSNFYVPQKRTMQLAHVEGEPFSVDTLERSYFAEFEGDPSGEPIGVSKKSDIHVKFLGRLNSTDRAGRLIADRAQFMRFLEEAGFYRIVSVSGNAIYTAQFIDGVVGDEIYSKLRQFVERTGLADSIVIEPCAYFWRKSMVVEGIRYHAKVSPIVKLRGES